MSNLIRSDSQQLSFYYGDELIHFRRVLSPHTQGKVLIKVHPDCSIVVSTPHDATDEAVLIAVKQRGRWIYQQLREFRQQLAYITPRRYISGESHYYLGKQYLLKVHVGPRQLQYIKLLRGKIEVSIRHYDSAKVQSMLFEWYKERAKQVFPNRLEVMLEQALWVTEAPSLRLLTMQTQWGSCSPNGRITLNPLLVKAPRDCIDYVILHELCHLVEHNHSERFYRLLGQVMPQWEITKQRLDSMASKILTI